MKSSHAKQNLRTAAFLLFLIQSQLSPIQTQAVQHYTDRTTCHGSTGNHRVKQNTI